MSELTGFSVIAIYPDGERSIWITGPDASVARGYIARCAADQPAIIEIKWDTFQAMTITQHRALVKSIHQKYPNRMQLNMKLGNKGRLLSNDPTATDRIKSAGRSIFTVDGALGRPW